MNAKRRMLFSVVFMPLVIILLISGLFAKNYFASDYGNIENAVYINDGKSILVAVKATDSTSSKIKFFELEVGTNKIIDSFNVQTNTLTTLNLKYDNNGALIVVINDDNKNSALSVYNIYYYQNGKKPELISSDMQSDTSMLNLFDWRDGIAIIDKDTNSDEAAIYIKNGKVTKQLFTANEDILNNIKRFANETAVKDSDELPYAEFSLYDGRTAYIGMFLEADGNFPIVIKDKATAINELASKLYQNKKLIKLYKSGSEEYSVEAYTYGKEASKTILNSQTPIYNAFAFYPTADQTIVLGTADSQKNSQRIGYVYDNATGEVLLDLSSALKNASYISVDENSTVYMSSNILCIIDEDQYYAIDTDTGNIQSTSNVDLLAYINKYDKYQLSTFYDYAGSSEGRMLLYNLALWVAFPIFMLIISAIARKQKKDVAKKSKIITGTIVAVNKTNMRMYGMTYFEFEVEAYLGGTLKTFKIKNAVAPNQHPSVGQSVVILYNSQNGKAMFADDKMVAAALGRPIVEEAVIDSIEIIDSNIEDIELARLTVSLKKDGNGETTVVPAVQTSILPYKIGETINIRYMSNTIDDTVVVVGRGKNISAARSNYSGEAEIISVRSIEPDIDGRYLMDIDTICKAKIGRVLFDNILLTKDISVLQPGVNIAFTADKELFNKRLRLQNLEQGIAVVSQVEATGDAVGYSPVLQVKLKMSINDGEEEVFTANENISPLNIPKVGESVLIGYDIETKEATIIKKQ